MFSFIAIPGPLQDDVDDRGRAAGDADIMRAHPWLFRYLDSNVRIAGMRSAETDRPSPA
jgi:hypothetical protein